MLLNSLLTAIGLRRPPAPDCGCPETPGSDPGLTAAITALGAKLARADGRPDLVEYNSFIEVFPHDPEAEDDIRRLYGLAGETTLGFESYARRIGKRYGACPELLERVIDGLFHVAGADGAVTGDELVYLERVSDLLGLSSLAYRRIRNDHLGAPADDPYGVLDVAPDASDETVRAAWKQALVRHHPDKAVGLGLSPERISAAERQASAINAAYETVMRERRAFVSAA